MCLQKVQSLIVSFQTHTHNAQVQTYRHTLSFCNNGNGECWGSRSFWVFGTLGRSIVSAPYPSAHTALRFTWKMLWADTAFKNRDTVCQVRTWPHSHFTTACAKVQHVCVCTMVCPDKRLKGTTVCVYFHLFPPLWQLSLSYINILLVYVRQASWLVMELMEGEILDREWR